MTLGAEGVQIGTRFAVAAESSAHPTFKQRVFDTEEGGTMLALKKLAPTRLIKNDFFNQVKALEDAGAEAAQLHDGRRVRNRTNRIHVAQRRNRG